jgi:hypothetical protein
MGENVKKQTEYLEYGDVINYTLDGVSIQFLTQLPKTKETYQGFHHGANGDFKTVTEFNGCERSNLRMDQQHYSYSTILT